MDSMFVSPQNSHVKALSPKATAFGGGACGGGLGLDEVVAMSVS